MKVMVLNIRGRPLMPCSPARARHLLDASKAIVKCRSPFTIQLTIATGETKQPVVLGVDSGSKNIGLSASTEKEELFAGEVELRQNITKLISDRKEYRRNRRYRKTRYRAARFNNRVHSMHKGKLAPSIENRIDAHISRIKLLCDLMPVSKIIIETASFDAQKLKNPDIEGEEYQNGEQLGFWNVREYVLFRDNHTCQCCHGKSKDKVLNIHHIESRKTGGNAPNNLITLCSTCHKALHAGTIELKVKRGQSFRDAAFMGIMRSYLLARVQHKYPNIPVENTFGYITKSNRINLQLPKTHCADAFCIAGNFKAIRRGEYLYQKQVRKHNRKIFKSKITKGGKRHLNQAGYQVNGFRRFDKVSLYGEVGFIYALRTSGYFEVRKFDGSKLCSGISYKKLRLLERRKSFISDYRKEKYELPNPIYLPLCHEAKLMIKSIVAPALPYKDYSNWR